jgi:hypothetical protein
VVQTPKNKISINNVYLTKFHILTETIISCFGLSSFVSVRFLCGHNLYQTAKVIYVQCCFFA